MKNKILLSLLFLPLFHYAQDSDGSCSSVKRFKNSMAKSNTFTVAQIAQTELYDVHYYFLNLNMTNTTTTLSGSAEIHAKARENLDTALVEFFNTFVISSIENGFEIKSSAPASRAASCRGLLFSADIIIMGVLE